MANKHLELAVELAKQSRCRQKHGAIVVRNGQIVAAGTNVSKGSAEVHWPIASMHAEQRVLLQAGKEAHGGTLYIARVNKHGQRRLSAPCIMCSGFIARSGISRVVWTIS